MGSVPLLPDDLRLRESYLGTRILPRNYMDDFSLMGFVVNNYEKACGLLETAGYKLEQRQFGSEIIISSPKELLDITALFRSNLISCEYSDIADTIYQA